MQYETTLDSSGARSRRGQSEILQARSMVNLNTNHGFGEASGDQYLDICLMSRRHEQISVNVIMFNHEAIDRTNDDLTDLKI